MARLKQQDPLAITGWYKPDGKRFSSRYGYLHFAEWLRCEADALAKDGIATEIVGPNEYGEVCLRRKAEATRT